MDFAQIRRFLKKQENKNKLKRLYTYSEVALYGVDAAKNVIDTLKPYKTLKHRQRDLLQFFHGIRNIVTGILLLPIAVLFFAIGILFSFANILGGGWVAIVKGWWKSLENLALNLIGSVAQISQGIFQVLTAPFALLRITWRTVLSVGRDWEKFQDRKSVQRLVNEADELLLKNAPGVSTHIRLILNELYRKAVSNQEKKQACYRVPPVEYSQKMCYGTIITFKANANYFVEERRSEEEERVSLTPGESQKIQKHLHYFRRG